MSTVKRAYRYRFYPTDGQKQQLARTFGCCRYVYNWALALRQQSYQATGKSLSYKTLDAHMTVLRHQEQTAFLAEVSCVPLQQSVRHLMRAYTNFLPGTRRFPHLQEAARAAIGHLYAQCFLLSGWQPHPRQDGCAPGDTLVPPTSRWRHAFHRDGLSR